MMLTDFAVFIMVWGRPDKMWTQQSLRKAGYTGKIYFVGDDLDDKIDQYKKKYKDDLLIFSKNEIKNKYDAGDNSGDLRTTMYAVNTIQMMAADRGIKRFMILCDDYTNFVYKYNENKEFHESKVRNLDKIIEITLSFFDKSGATSIAFAQNGDFIGGKNSRFGRNIYLLRKVMNSFICSSDKSFVFMGRMNEDVTTYVNLGGKGYLFLTIPNVSIMQKRTQSVSGGLTEMYLDYGTYQKSFFSVMYNPSCVKVSIMGDKHKRIHHKIKWNSAVPCIINETHRKK